jgi:hypothetical protein
LWGSGPEKKRAYQARWREGAMKKKALITGITGQDGSYLAEALLERDYEVFGMARRTSTTTFGRI